MHYFDYAAACPIRPEIVERYPAYCRCYFVNPHASTIFAEECRRAILAAERRLLYCLAIPEESAQVLWCSGGTEALNLAILGLTETRKIRRIAFDPTAHPAMLEPLLKLQRQHTELVSLPVNHQGLLQPNTATAAFPCSLLCCCQVNNETGQVQDLLRLRQAFNQPCLFCIDAVQSLGKIHIPWQEAQLNLVALSARKIGGPASIGALIVRKGIKLTSQILGGGQQHALRSGTLDTVAIQLFADCAELACQNRVKEAERLRQLNQILRQGLQQLSQGKWPIFSNPDSVPDILCFAIPGCEGALVARFLAEQKNILVGTGSACSAESKKTSHVLAAMGVPPDLARCALRISFGYNSTQENLNALLKALPEVLQKFR
ncbi:MAG: aminotransferase class V-fold PLP-dependent enzyme [Lentisphaeria bacterium]